MSVATEIAVASLKDDVDVEDPNSDANKTLLGSLRQIRAWAGCSGVRWGVEEGSKTLRLFVDWESIEAHAKANQQPEYLPVVIPLGTLCTGHVYYHAHFDPQKPEALTSAAVTIEITLYFEESFSEDDRTSFHQKMKTTGEIYQHHADGYVASTSGWVDEPQPIPGTSDTGRAYVALVGWKSSRQASAFPKSKTFKDHFEPLYFQNAVKGTKVVHIQCRDVQLE